MTQNNINLNGINGDSLVEMQDSKLNDYQHQLDMLKAEDKLKQLEEDKLEKIIMLCKSYNEAQSRKQLKSFTVNEGDLILNKIKKPSPLLPWIKISNQDLDFKYVNGLDGKDYENENDEEDEDEVDDDEGKVKEEPKVEWDDNFEALNSLIMEKGLIKGEIEEMKSQHFSDVEDEELREFQRIEKELRLNELYKCLETIDKQILKHQKEYCGLWNQINSKSCDDHQVNQDDSSQEDDGDDEDDDTQGNEAEDEREDETEFEIQERDARSKEELNRPQESFNIMSQSRDSSSNQMACSNESNSNLSSLVEVSNLKSSEDEKVNLRPKKEKNQRPLTLYLPSLSQNLDLINHIQTLGHDVTSFSSLITLTSNTCSGYLWKLCSNSENRWLKRFFHFDRMNKVLIYYRSVKRFQKSKKPKYVVFFEDIEDVYVDHNRIKSNKSSLARRKKQRYVFVIVTSLRHLTLSVFVPEVMRIWIDVIFTGAEGYLEFE